MRNYYTTNEGIVHSREEYIKKELKCKDIQDVIDEIWECDVNKNESYEDIENQVKDLA